MVDENSHLEGGGAITNPVNAAYRTKLEKWVESEKPYLNPNFQLTDLSQVLPLNRSYLSRFINSTYDSSFYQWVSDLRIREAKRLLTEHPEMKIHKVARQSGFSSSTVFCRVFARETGVAPSQWLSTQNNPK